VDRSFPWSALVRLGALLRAFVLSGEPEVLFHVSKPEDEQVVLWKAIRQGVEVIDVGGAAVRGPCA
jgi:hypothetical protein